MKVFLFVSTLLVTYTFGLRITNNHNNEAPNLNRKFGKTKSTTSATTHHYKTTSTQSPITTHHDTPTTTIAPETYDCLDIMVDSCNDDSHDEIETFSDIDTLHFCQALCDLVYTGLCQSYIYHNSAKTCKILREPFYSYLYKCDIQGAGYDTIKHCLKDDAKYPNQCKNMIQSNCEIRGVAMEVIHDVVEPEECFNANAIYNGGYYVHQRAERKCTIFESNKRECFVQRGPSKMSDCPP